MKWADIFRRRPRPMTRWCPMCERHTEILVVLDLDTEQRDHHQPGDLGCRTGDGQHHAIVVASRSVACDVCRFPHTQESPAR